MKPVEVVSNLKRYDLWDVMNYPLRKEEADTIIEALEQQKPVEVQAHTIWDDITGGICECGKRLNGTDKFCPECGRKLKWKEKGNDKERGN